MATEAQRDAAEAVRAGRRLAWLGYLTIAASIGGWVALDWNDSSDAPALTGIVAAIGIWAGSGGVAYGDRLRGRLGPGEAIRPGNGILGLGVLVVIVLFSKTLEEIGPWWLLTPPIVTHDLLLGIGVPFWPAAFATAVLAVPEVIVMVMLANILVAKPLQMVFGRRSVVVETVRGVAGGVDLDEDTPSGRHNWNMWVGDPVVPAPA
jgi:peptidoglycan/LPS O-acetylase OafA/YrhL